MIAAKRKNKKGMKSNKFQWLCFFFFFFWQNRFLVSRKTRSQSHTISCSLSHNVFLNLPQPRFQSLTTSLSISYNLVLRVLPDLVASLSTNPSLKKTKTKQKQIKGLYSAMSVGKRHDTERRCGANYHS